MLVFVFAKKWLFVKMTLSCALLRNCIEYLFCFRVTRIIIYKRTTTCNSWTSYERSIPKYWNRTSDICLNTSYYQLMTGTTELSFSVSKRKKKYYLRSTMLRDGRHSLAVLYYKKRLDVIVRVWRCHWWFFKNEI